MKNKIKLFIIFNSFIAFSGLLIQLQIDYVSQFAALLVIFVFPAAGLVLFKESAAALKVALGFVYSTVISMAILALFVSAGIPARPLPYMAALALAGNSLLLFGMRRGPAVAFSRKSGGYYRAAVLVALVAGGLSFWGATRVVPVLQDHDSVMECPAYGLATTLKPYCIETRVPFYLAKGPTSHFIYAFPLVLTGKLERVKHYYDSAQAALAAPDPERNIVRLWHAEFKRWFPGTAQRVIVETRTTSVFISIMLALLLFTVVGEIAASDLLALALGVVFLTLPEIFVRNSYAGYQNVSNFFLLLALYLFLKDRENLAVPLLLATVNQKCVIILGLAVASWLLLNWPGWKKALRNRTLAGLAAGMLLLYAYGWIIHPASLLQDQFQRHGVDRLLHQNPIPGMNYPSFWGLWKMFFLNYGVLFVLLAAAAVALLLRERRAFPRATVLAALIAATAMVFSLVDWKMTKHLDLMVPAMVLAMACAWRLRLRSAPRKWRLLAQAGLGAILLVNGWIIVKLAQDFSWLKVSPIW
ncbi:MAG: hypothetical protein JXO51_06820 [Candidatus Aminicenantes bacterium]|nr:hypothetical protein [Candidatus Aminicenantes bacterium]